MSCNCEYGICDQTAHCPVRATPAIPKPEQCVKAGMCQSDTEHCPCDADDQPMLPLSMTDKVCFWGVLLCCSIAFCLGMAHWLGWP